MKKLLLAATAALFASTAYAGAAQMPDALVGQWCRTSGDDVRGWYVKAKTACKATRPITFTINKFGMWIKLAGIKPMIMCLPQQVQSTDPDWEFSWSITADCGADDNSTPVYRITFDFDDVVTAPNKVMITKR
jgi:hypothetical protein